MKQRVMLLSALLAALLLAGVGCTNDNVTPSPTVRPTASANPTTNPSTSPTAGATDMLPSGTDDLTGGGGTIEGFAEGQNLEVSSLPEKVTSAVKETYPNATIESATFATYMDQQMYHLMLAGASDNTTEVYVQADGTILPYDAQSTPGTTAGGADGGSGSGGSGTGGNS